jgi:hypothetical protein
MVRYRISNRLTLGDDIRTGLMIDSERVYTEVTSN